MAKRCVVCGTTDGLTRDHVVPRLVLRMHLGREQYSAFCSDVRKVNIQPMCADDNGLKGHRVCDLRPEPQHKQLLEALDRYGILDEIVFEPGEEIFGDRLCQK